MPEVFTNVISLFSAVLATLVGSFSGGGASLVMFPLVLMVAKGSYASLLTVTKVGTSVMTLVSGRIHAKKNSLNRSLFLTITITGLLGTGLGTYFVQYQLDELFFKQILAFVLLSTAVYLLFAKKKGIGHETPRDITRNVLLITVLYCFPINVLNGLFGGAGIFLTIYLVVFLRFAFIQAIGYTMISYLMVNLLHSTYLLATEPVSLSLVLFVVLGSLIGSWVGTHLQYLKGNAWVKRVAVTMMGVIGIHLVYSMVYISAISVVS